MNRKVFFDNVRKTVFGGRLNVSQVEGMSLILDTWDAQGGGQRQYLSCMLGESFHESAHTMQPIHERGGDSYFVKHYWTNMSVRKMLGNLKEQDAIDYHGRGLIQITGRRNYTIFAGLLGIDLIKNPDLALKPDVSVKIMFAGMKDGIFTGKKLSNYLVDGEFSFVASRAIVNGHDDDVAIAVYCINFDKAILEAVK